MKLDMLKDVIGRDMTPEELKTMLWLGGWEPHHVKNIMGLLADAKQYGMNNVKPK
jgi:hypothetical protein